MDDIIRDNNSECDITVEDLPKLKKSPSPKENYYNGLITPGSINDQWDLLNTRLDLKSASIEKMQLMLLHLQHDIDELKMVTKQYYAQNLSLAKENSKLRIGFSKLRDEIKKIASDNPLANLESPR